MVYLGFEFIAGVVDVEEETGDEIVSEGTVMTLGL